MGLDSNQVVDEVTEKTVALLYARFKRIEARKFAPLRVLRYRIILRKIRKAKGEV